MKRGADEEFGSFEKSTKGFGMKMLLKMGYKTGSGLGKEGKGIVNPIEIKLRARNTGLGFDEADEGEKGEAVYGDTRPKPKTPWRRKRREEKGKESSLESSEDEVAWPEKVAPVSTRIFDFTGSKVRELSSLSEIHAPPVIEKHARFPEIRHNLSLLISLSTSDVKTARLTSQGEEQTFLRLSEEHERLQAEIKKLEAKRAEIFTLKQLVFKGTELVGKDSEEYFRWAVDAVQFIADQGNLEENRIVACSALVSAFGPIFRNFEITDAEFVDKVNRLAEIANVQVGGFSSPVDQLVTSFVIPKLRSALLESLQATQAGDCQNGASLLASWVSVLSPSTMEPLYTITLLPALHRALDFWDYKATPLHVWLLPWLPCLTPYFQREENFDKKDEFFAAVRRKMATFVEKAKDPLQEIKVISYWKPPVLPRREFDTLLGRCILPHIEANIEHGLLIDPANQDVALLTKVLSWLSVVEPAILAPYIARPLFPKLKRTLYDWMTSDTADFEEITLWYLAWKDLFPPDLSESAPLSVGFGELLDLMNTLLEELNK
jgi:tuftelin-interacting protein 11